MKRKSSNHKTSFKVIASTAQQNDLATISKKLPTWAATTGISFPTHLSLEQCSGEKAAAYKEEIITRLFPERGEIMADLTGGLGVDFSFLVRHFHKGIYIERQNALCEAARNNFPKLGLENVDIIEGDGTQQIQELPQSDLIYIDPARRNHEGRKTVLIEDCEPDVLDLLPTLWRKTSCIMLKLSPMLDLSRAITSLREVSEAHIVAENGECKELLLVLQKNADSTTIICRNDDQKFTFTREEEMSATARYADFPMSYLYEPNATIMKAGAFKLIGQHYQLEKLHMNSHLYTSEEYVPDFPGRTFHIRQVYGFAKKEIRELCNSVEKANLTIRNFPGSVAELRKKLKVKEGGDAYWFATTLANEKHVIIDCRKMEYNKL